LLNMTDFEYINANEIGEKNKNKKFGWQIFAFSALLLAIISLIGLWYVNNERLFLLIDNNKLKIEVKTLKEEIATLKAINNNNSSNSTEEISKQTEGSRLESKQNKNNYTIYEVKYGDSLTSISIAFYGTEIYASKIAELNGITPESILQLGQKLKIPDKPKEANN